MTPPRTVRLSVVGSSAPGPAPGLVVMLAVIAFWSWIAIKTWRGGNWARIGQAVLLALDLAFLVGGSVRDGEIDPWWVAVFELSTISAILLWTRSAQPLFGERSAKSAGGPGNA